jgi:hypothetical protein
MQLGFLSMYEHKQSILYKKIQVQKKGDKVSLHNIQYFNFNRSKCYRIEERFSRLQEKKL